MPRHTQYVALRATLAAPGLPAAYVVRLAPQLFYLKQDERSGSYLNAAATASRRNLPWSVSTVVNRAVRTSIAGERLLWNLSLHYAIR